jgi:hypothetical protein
MFGQAFRLMQTAEERGNVSYASGNLSKIDIDHAELTT